MIHSPWQRDQDARRDDAPQKKRAGKRRTAWAAWMAGALLLCLLVILSGCRENQSEGGFQLWFPTLDENLASAMDTCPYEGELNVPSVAQAILHGPSQEELNLLPAVPPGVQLLDWSFENRVAKLKLSSQYGTLEGVHRTLADYCFTITLTQLQGVDGVVIQVEGGSSTGILRPSDALFSGVEEEPVEVTARLYFRLGMGDTLGYELRMFRLTENMMPAEVVLEALTAGPSEPGLTMLLPEKLEVNASWMAEGICYVDLSRALLENMPETPAEQELLISSIVDSLCSLDAIHQVQILVDGETISWYGSVDLSNPLLPGTD